MYITYLCLFHTTCMHTKSQSNLSRLKYFTRVWKSFTVYIFYHRRKNFLLIWLHAFKADFMKHNEICKFQDRFITQKIQKSNNYTFCSDGNLEFKKDFLGHVCVIHRFITSLSFLSIMGLILSNFKINFLLFQGSCIHW